MSHLAELLAAPDLLLRRAKSKAPEPLKLRRAVAALQQSATAERSEASIAEIQERIAWAAEQGMSLLSRRDLREGCRSFLYPPHPPGRSPEIGDKLVAEVVTLQRRAAYLALIDAYLDCFAYDDPDIVRLAQALAKSAKTWPWRPTDPWPHRLKAFNLFDPVEAPSRIAAAILKSEDPVRGILIGAGLDSDGRRLGGLVETAFKAACQIVSEMSSGVAPSPQDRLISWATDSGKPLDFPKAWPAYAGALFKPWVGKEPADDHRAKLIESALGYAGDPRVNEARWRPVRDEYGDAYDVIVRWLTKASVEQFFDIVSETMTDRPDMWEQRRRFWTRYLKADKISAAWVAFGSDGASRATRIARSSGDRGLTMFGRLSSGGGRTAQHASLIMRIGDLVVAEWSHNGRCYFWHYSDKRAPKLFRNNEQGRADYDPSELMGAPFDATHSIGWERRIATILRDEAGVRL